MRSGLVCSITSNNLTPWLRLCRVQACGTHSSSDATNRQRLVVLHASKRASDPTDLEDIAQQRYGMAYGQLSKQQQASCIAEKGNNIRWGGHKPKPKAKDDEELQRLAQEKFGKAYHTLSASGKKACASNKGLARVKAAVQHSIKEGTTDEALQAIAMEKFGKGLADVTEQELGVCIGAKASRARWQGHQAKPKATGEADEELQRLAQEKYGKPYQLLTTSEKRACSGAKGAAKRLLKPEVLADFAAMSSSEALGVLAMEKFGKPYAELDSREKKVVINAKSRRMKKLRAGTDEEPTHT